MGKIVKYCAACEESFAEKFAFCPNCGNAMEAFEMNPLKETVKAEETAPIATDNDDVIAQTSLPELPETSSNIEPAIAAEAAALSTDGEMQSFADASNFDDDDIELEMFDNSETEDFKDEVVEIAADEPETFAVAAAAGASGKDNQYQNQIKNYQPSVNKNIPSDRGFQVTVIKEKNVKQRNGLLLGALILMLTLTAGGMVYSIFNHPLLVGAIGDDQLLTLVPVIDEVPMDVEEEPKPKADKDSGGGGGGGRNEQTPTSQGRLATQTREEPLITPTKTIPQKTDFDLKMIASTVGDKQIKPTDEPYGDPNSKYTLGSDGRGKGGGQGSGEGSGQGSGRGTGQGSGLGSGSGGGIGDGSGDGSGSGNSSRDREAPPPPPKQPVGVTEKIKIISKPKPGYTDQARTNQVQGTVRVRVTFLNSGQIGSVTPVSGLPYGLTEQAIAAAKQIRFEPAKKNGIAQTSVITVEYSFSIY
ncbi:hypothetical protein BH20ACI1_BH20ACI1_23290 [soil metagenome]